MSSDLRRRLLGATNSAAFTALAIVTAMVIGALVIVTMETYLAQFGAWVTVIQGLVFVLCVLLFREGIVGLVARRLGRPL